MPLSTLEDSRLDQAWTLLDEAVAAAESGEVILEERKIQEAVRIVAGIPMRSFWEGWRTNSQAGLSDAGTAFNERLTELTAQGSLRRGAALGFVGSWWFWADRILAPDRSAYLMDATVHASVETAGSITVSRRPTMTRMAAGAILPGSALIPGFAFQKKESFDSRELYFTFEHPDGGAVIQVAPQFGQAVRAVALAVNQAAAELDRMQTPSDPAIGPTAESGATADWATKLSVLKEMAALRDAGVLSEEEFVEQKAEFLRDSVGAVPHA